MYKKLSRIGNSLAIVVDKPIREVLGWGRETIVKLSTDGRRLVIERVPRSEVEAMQPSLGEKLDAPRVWKALLDKGLEPDQFARLYHGVPRMPRYQAFLHFGLKDPKPEQIADMKRMEACLRALEAGASWDAAIEQALRVAPRDQTSTTSAGGTPAKPEFHASA